MDKELVVARSVWLDTFQIQVHVKNVLINAINALQLMTAGIVDSDTLTILEPINVSDVRFNALDVIIRKFGSATTVLLDFSP